MLKKILLISLVSLTFFFNSHIAFGQYELISSNLLGTNSGNSRSELATQSSDGRYIAFASEATNLLPTINSPGQIYVRDLETGNLELVSVNYSQTGRANSGSINAKISANGRHVLFYSYATDLVQSTPAFQDSNKGSLFVRDLETKTTYLVQPPPLLRSMISHPFYYGLEPMISSNGRFVAYTFLFNKSRTQFRDKGGILDSRIYVWDRETGQTRLVSTNVPLIFNVQILPSLLAMTPDGRFIVFSNSCCPWLPPEITPFLGIFVYDVITGEIEQIDVRLHNTEVPFYGGGSAFISKDGRYVVFEHNSRDLTNIPDNQYGKDIFIRDRLTQTTRLVSTNYSQTSSADRESQLFSISSDARFVVFASDAKDLILNHPIGHGRDVFVWDVLDGSKICVSRDIPNLGNQPNNYFGAKISDSGDNVMIHTAKVPRDIYSFPISEIFVLNTITNQTSLISNFPGSSETGIIVRPSMSKDGRRIVFQTTLRLLQIDTNDVPDIYAYSNSVNVTPKKQ